MLVLHGDDYVNSRNELQKHKDGAVQKSKEIITLDGQKIQLTDLKQAVESLSLFGTDRLVVIENVFGGQKSARQGSLIDYLIQNQPETVIVWETKALTPASIKKLTNTHIQEFKPKTIIFDFLASIRPNNQKQILKLYQQVLQSDPVELVFFLMVKQMRQLFTASSDPQSLTGPSWLTTKINSQAKLFSTEHLLKLYQGLFEIEKGLKTGLSPVPIETALEMWLTTI